MEKDLQIIRDILKDLHYSELSIEKSISYIIKRFNESGLDSITPNFLYYSLLHDEGKRKSEEISDRYKRKKYFDDDETPIQKWARERGYDK